MYYSKEFSRTFFPFSKEETEVLLTRRKKEGTFLLEIVFRVPIISEWVLIAKKGGKG